MPNWAEGTLKIRGSQKNLLKFCKERLGERTGDEEKAIIWEIRHYGGNNNGLVAKYYSFSELCIWLKDSRRMFIDMGNEVPYNWDVGGKDISEDPKHSKFEYESLFYLYKMSGEDDWLVVFPFQAAWDVREDYFEQMSKEYDLVFRVYTVEQGMGFFSEILVKDGETTELGGGPAGNSGYGEFVWECPFPFLGG